MKKLSKGFLDEQELLERRAASGAVRHVVIDPDGSQPSYLGIVVAAATGVVYAQQCGGVACDLRLIEGFWIPMGGVRILPEDGLFDVTMLTAPFHRDGGCAYTWVGEDLPPDRAELLARTVAEIPYWTATYSVHRTTLQLSTSRVEQIAEAWVPVETPDGPGVLLWKNCD